MTDETTTEQLAAIEGQAEPTPGTVYTPPEGWRVVQFGELLQPGDMWVNQDGTEQRSNILQWDASAVSGGRCIRRIKPEAQPQPQPQPQPEPVQVREGRWRRRSGVEVSVSAMPTDHDDFTEAFPWWDGHETTWTQSGHLLSSGECPADLVEYLGPIEEEPQPQPQPVPVPEFKRHTFAAYIVGDKIQPDALRIVWATEEWIEQSKFGIVHRMRDMHLFDNDGGCNITEYHETLTLTLKVQ